MITEEQAPPTQNVPPSESQLPPVRPAGSFLNHLADLIRNHIELARLELAYEIKLKVQRLIALSASAAFGLVIFVLLQIAIVHGLIGLGLPLGAACLVLAVVYGAIVGFLVKKVGVRSPDSGEAFQATREELQRSKEWIRKRFS